jgi:hypothetical protein
MNINSLAHFLSGIDFKSDLRVKIEDANEYNRLDFLSEKVPNKSVLHVGCADHAPVVERKMADNEWLHGILTDVASACLGIDINQAAIDELKSRHGVENIINWNIMTDPVPAEVASKHWDYVLLGEVLEHIDNPVSFLSTLREKLNQTVDTAIITVPNAWQYLNWKKALKGIEIINSDHRYWFTPYTICKVATCAGLTPTSLTMCEYHDMNKNIARFSLRRLKKLLKQKFLKKKPLLRQCIVLEAEFQPEGVRKGF